ncbi:hypothetical protein OHB49_43190 (plasmid) [Streptomyces sp. NBC_01717]|uniref:hypothetical protein n=1 Tax=Streptomyces sp. NBC_01717 TaxID=2975918 RepID=UPI002E33801C|nr:hypothetical protein [Streptomyces sp. NBC_01717]
MGNEYSADPDGILQGCSKLEDARVIAERLAPEFEERSERFFGWWGEEGCDDDFANQVGPACRDEFERACAAVASVGSGFGGLLHAFVGQARYVQNPQNMALDDIHHEGSQTERR